MAPQGRKGDGAPEIKPLTKAQIAAANKPGNAVPANLKPVVRGSVKRWVKK